MVDWEPPDTSHIDKNIVDTPLGRMPTGSRPVRTSQEAFLRVVTTCERLYRQSRGMPAPELILANIKMPAAKVLRIMASREFANEMALRGISWTSKTAGVRELTPDQQLVLGLITDPTNKRSLRQKLEGAGVSYSVYRNWLSQPAFREAISAISENMLGDHIADVHASVVQKASNGDIQAARLVYELTGRHDPAKQQIVDLGRMVGLLLEVLTRHVVDPKVLGKVQSDFDRVIKGESLPALEQLPRNYNDEDSHVEANHTAQKAADAVIIDAAVYRTNDVQHGVANRGDSSDRGTSPVPDQYVPPVADGFFDFDEDE